MNIWKLHVIGNNYCGFAPGIGYSPEFETTGMPIGIENWHMPVVPEADTAKPLPDFASFLDGYPTVSECVKNKITERSETSVEFLPFSFLKGKLFWLANVFRVISLKQYECHMEKSDDYEHNKLIPFLFKIRGRPLEIFCNRDFGNFLIENNFKGLALTHPDAEILVWLLRKKEFNIFPGLKP